VSAPRLIFDIAGAAAVVFAAILVVHRNPIKGLLAAVVSLFAIAGEFVLLSSPFLAAIQVIVYAGAILVLFLFVLMLLNLDREAGPEEGHRMQKLLGFVAIVLFAGMMLAAVRSSGALAGSSGEPAPTGEVVPLAAALFSQAALPFEAVSILLLAALVGAFVLARRDSAPRPPEERP